jgi:hypothetical protein
MIKSQDDLNPCNDGKRSSDVLLSTIEELERTKKQLDIAVGTLRCYGNPNNWDGNRFTNFFATWQLARNNLDKIKELNEIHNQE